MAVHADDNVPTPGVDRPKILRPEHVASAKRSGRTFSPPADEAAEPSRNTNNLALMLARRAVARAVGALLRGTKRPALAAALGVSDRLVGKWCEEAECDQKPLPAAAIVALPREEREAVVRILLELGEQMDRGEIG